MKKRKIDKIAESVECFVSLSATISRCRFCNCSVKSSLRLHLLYNHVNPLYWTVCTTFRRRHCLRKTKLYREQSIRLRRQKVTAVAANILLQSCLFNCNSCGYLCNSSKLLLRHFETATHNQPSKQEESTVKKASAEVILRESGEYEEISKLEINPELYVPDLKATIAENLKSYLQGGAVDIQTVSFETDYNLSAVTGSQSQLSTVAESCYFYDIPIQRRRSGLHGLRRNAQATLCNRCFQCFLDVLDFELHPCCQQLLRKSKSNGAVTTNVQNPAMVIEDIASIVVVRNESNLPPDLGNGYRRPLFALDTSASLDPPLYCTACNSTYSTIESLHCHMVVCGHNKVATTSSTTASPTKTSTSTARISIAAAATSSILSPPQSSIIAQNPVEITTSTTKRVVVNNSQSTKHQYNTRMKSATGASGEIVQLQQKKGLIGALKANVLQVNSASEERRNSSGSFSSSHSVDSVSERSVDL